MAKVCCFGELLLRFSPMANGEWIRQARMPVYVGGAELNVATALANWHVPVKYSTVLPENSLADDIVTYISDKGIDPSGVVRFGQRVGSYYLPQGTDLKNAGVIYDRATGIGNIERNRPTPPSFRVRSSITSPFHVGIFS